MDAIERQRQQVRHVPSLSADHEARLRLLLAQCLDRCEADQVLLIDRGGVLLGVHGQEATLEVDTIAALTAGSFAATRELAARVGEEEFDVLYHQGRHHHILMHAVCDLAILVAVFSNTTTVGMVRIILREASRDAAELLEAAVANPTPAGAVTFTARALDSLGPVFAGPDPVPPDPSAG